MYITTAVSIIMTIIFIIYLLYIFGSIFPRSGTVRNRPEPPGADKVRRYRNLSAGKEVKREEKKRERERSWNKIIIKIQRIEGSECGHRHLGRCARCCIMNLKGDRNGGGNKMEKKRKEEEKRAGYWFAVVRKVVVLGKILIASRWIGRWPSITE